MIQNDKPILPSKFNRDWTVIKNKHLGWLLFFLILGWVPEMLKFFVFLRELEGTIF